MIRLANKFDVPVLTEMMRKYAKESPIVALQNPEVHNRDHIKGILEMIIIGRGFALVDDQMKGMLIALITPNFWCPRISEIKEIAWWVHPEYRDGSIGGRLFLKFMEHSEELVKQGRAEIICASLMSTSSVTNLPRMKKIETTYVKE
jgi:N-acetylglutamate synthase-like GNAT family acetyltransferase